MGSVVVDLLSISCIIDSQRLRCLNDRLIVYKLNIEVINRQAIIAKDR